MYLFLYFICFIFCLFDDAVFVRLDSCVFRSVFQEEAIRLASLYRTRSTNHAKRMILDLTIAMCSTAPSGPLLDSGG